jgi:hypothetical protein
MHPSFRDLKTLHLFLRDFGSSLAPMTAWFPKETPHSKQDRDTPRAAVRSDGSSGYLFLNNYQKDHRLPMQREFQAEIKLADTVLSIPRRPIDIPSGAYTFWPFHMDLGGVTLEYATAQPLCRLTDPDTVVFFAWPGINPEFVFHETVDTTVEVAHAHVERSEGRMYVTGISPGLDAVIRIRKKNGGTTQIVLVSRDQARDIWKAPLVGRDRLVFSPADVYFDGDRIHLNSSDPLSLRFGVYPQLGSDVAGFRDCGANGVFDCFAATIPPAKLNVSVEPLAPAGRVPPVKMGKGVAMAPPEGYFASAARWRVRVPDFTPAADSEVLLHLDYQGDVARIYAGGRLITDDFYHGAPWEIGLRNLPPEELRRGLELAILPLRQDAPIYLAAGASPDLPPGGQVVKISQIRLVPQHAVAAVLQ